MPESRDPIQQNGLKQKGETVELKPAADAKLPVAVVQEKSADLSTSTSASPSASELATGDVADVTPLKPALPAGMRRRRFAIASTALLATSVFLVSVADLKPLISQDGTIDRNFKFTAEIKPPEPPPDFSYSNHLSEGLIAIANSERQPARYGFADAKGQIVIPSIYEDVKDFSEGLAAVKLPSDAGKWGFIDHTGKMVIPAIYTTADSFHNGYAVAFDYRRQLIDKNGNVFRIGGNNVRHDIPGGFRIIEKPASALYGVAKGNEVSIPCRYDDITQIATVEDSSAPPFFKLRTNGMCGLADGNGKIYFLDRFDDIVSVHNGFALVKKDTAYGFCDLNGKFVIMPQFAQCTAYDDLIAVRSGDKIRFINSANMPVEGAKVDNVVFNSDTAQWFHDGLGLIRRDGLYGYLDKQGHEVIAARFKNARPFSEGVARVLEGSRWIFIDKHGNKATEAEYTQASQFHNGTSEVTVPGPLYGVMKETPYFNSSINYFGRPAEKFDGFEGEVVERER
ncbi:MAG: WG repeat-containing protein [Candidatus Obscuribacterales bacterium]|nr:WG repeat-containing protein [Candidatus Obscuribacterales bacterium]